MLVKNLTTINGKDGVSYEFKLYGSNILLDRHLLGKNSKAVIKPFKIETTTIKTKIEGEFYKKWEEIFENILSQYYKGNPKVLKNVKKYASEYARNMISAFAETVGVYKIPVEVLARKILGMKEFVERVDTNSCSDELTEMFNLRLRESYLNFIDLFSLGGLSILPETIEKETIIGHGLAGIESECSKSGLKEVYRLPLSTFSQGVVGDKIEFDSELGFYDISELCDRLGTPELAEEWAEDLNEIADVIPQGLAVHTLVDEPFASFEDKHFALAREPETSLTSHTLGMAAKGFVKQKIRPTDIKYKNFYSSPFSPREQK